MHKHLNIYAQFMRSIFDIRRENLQKFARKAGGINAFSREVGMGQSQMSQIIGSNPKRNIGEELARKFEGKLNIEPFSLDRDYLDANTNILDSLNLVHIKFLDVQQTEDEGVFMFESDEKTVPMNEKDLKKIRVKKEDCVGIKIFDDLMLPFLEPEDTLLIDTSQKDIHDGGIYLLNMHGRIAVRRLFKEFDGRVKVVCDNTYQKIKSPDTYFELNNPNCGLTVIGKAFSVNKLF